MTPLTTLTYDGLMPSTTTERPQPQIRIDAEVQRLIESNMRAKESYNTALRRMLGLDAAERREDGSKAEPA